MRRAVRLLIAPSRPRVAFADLSSAKKTRRAPRTRFQARQSLPSKIFEPMTAIILSAMMTLTPYYGDRFDTPEARRELYAPIAQAIALAARGDRELVAALIAQGWHESKWARPVIEGRCQEMPAGQRCDAGRARTPFQVHGWCRAAFRAPDGSGASLEAGARCAASMLRAGRARCRSWVGAFAGMRGGWSCESASATARASTMRQVLVALRAGPNV